MVMGSPTINTDEDRFTVPFANLNGSLLADGLVCLLKAAFLICARPWPSVVYIPMGIFNLRRGDSLVKLGHDRGRK